MYGSDPDVETISMKPESEIVDVESMNEHTVCTWLVDLIQAILHVNQDAGLLAQLERLNIHMHNLSLMVDALAEAEGSEASSFRTEAEHQLSDIHSPQSTPDIPLHMEEDDHETHCGDVE